MFDSRHHPVKARWCTLLLVCAAIACGIAAASAPAATSSVTVAASVVAATSLDTSACVAPSTLQFGALQPGSAVVTSADCVVAFGSTNGVSQLQVRQADGAGVGMFQPASGALDPTFDSDGVVTTAAATGAGADTPSGLVRQPDGRLVTGGDCDMGATTGVDLCLVRYTTTGSLDPTFGVGGKVTTSVGPGARTDRGFDLLLQPDGKFVLVGACDMGATGNDICLVRYDTSGALDPTFSGDGIATTSISAFASLNDSARGVALRSDGSIVIGGFIEGVTGTQLLVARYRSDGALDPSFGSGAGYVVTDALGTGGNQEFRDLVIQEDGRVIGAGYCYVTGTSTFDGCAVRYTDNGALDPSFDGDGVATFAVAPGTGTDSILAAALQADGKLVVGGDCAMGGATGVDGCIFRLRTDGTLDPAFGTGGRVTLARSAGTGTDHIWSLLPQGDGTLVTAGDCDLGLGSGVDLCFARYLATGVLDPTFDGDGFLARSVAPGAGIDQRARATIDDADGHFASVGNCAMGATGVDACLLVFDSAGSMPQYAAGVSDWTTPGTGLFGACLVSTTGSVADWTANATCPAANGAWWAAVPTSATTIAHTTAVGASATSRLRFGVRTRSNETPGAYVAPVLFSVTSP
ncbi:MAG: uncharacterized protein JWN72_2027 [Thermoleophilia bacterium]|nr:uncharacterized protein [Thermoleophilia bacterium]